jgi:hypothetical protein
MHSAFQSRWLTTLAAVGLTLLPFIGSLAASEPLDLFDSEAAARKHCGNDAVVWLDVPSKTYWMKRQKGYGTSKAGGYTCRRDAVASGNRAKRG